MLCGAVFYILSGCNINTSFVVMHSIYYIIVYTIRAHSLGIVWLTETKNKLNKNSR